MRWIARVPLILVLTLMSVSLPVVFPSAAQSPAPAAVDPFKALAFLEGNWEAKTSGAGGVNAIGVYAFEKELGGHVMGRHAIKVAGCSGPKQFDCEHGDLLYVFPEGAGLKAIYLDNEGHVIHYDVTMPSATSVMFLSDGSQPGPQFRLTYELKDAVMTGKFQMKMPGGADWRSTWSGAEARVRSEGGHEQGSRVSRTACRPRSRGCDLQSVFGASTCGGARWMAG